MGGRGGGAVLTTMAPAAANPLAPAWDSGVLHRSALVLALQIVIQARGLIQVPFLTRALTADELGSLTLAMSMAGTASVLVLLGLHTGFFLNLVRLEAPWRRSAVASGFSLAVTPVGGTDLVPT